MLWAEAETWMQINDPSHIVYIQSALRPEKPSFNACTPAGGLCPGCD
jgi:hypothetical protein